MPAAAGHPTLAALREDVSSYKNKTSHTCGAARRCQQLQDIQRLRRCAKMPAAAGHPTLAALREDASSCKTSNACGAGAMSSITTHCMVWLAGLSGHIRSESSSDRCYGIQKGEQSWFACGDQHAPCAISGPRGLLSWPSLHFGVQIESELLSRRSSDRFA